MLKRIAVATAVTGVLLAGALTTSANAAHVGGGLGGAPGAHVGGGLGGAPHVSPGVPHMHGPGPGAHARVYGWHGGGNYPRVHHRRGFGVIVGGGYPYYYDDDYGYGYGGGCEWLHARAAATGSRYWWRRYEDCVEG